MLDKLFGDDQDQDLVRIQRRQERVRERMTREGIGEEEATRLIQAEEESGWASMVALPADPEPAARSTHADVEHRRPDPDRPHPVDLRVERIADDAPLHRADVVEVAGPPRGSVLDADMPPATSRTPVAAPERAVPSDPSAPLVDEARGREIAARWEAVQARFVDQPREAVREADALIGAMMKELTDGLGAERRRMEQQWSRDDASTEELRVALQRYRSVFQRLLSI